LANLLHKKSGLGPSKKNRDHFPARKFSIDPRLQFPDPHAGEPEILGSSLIRVGNPDPGKDVDGG
jgi:hypothetical protein